jgi:hypothetical protein
MQSQLAELRDRIEAHAKHADAVRPTHVSVPPCIDGWAPQTTLRLEEKIAKEATATLQAASKRIKDVDTKMTAALADLEQLKARGSRTACHAVSHTRAQAAVANEGKERAKSDREHQRQRGLIAEKLQAKISQEVRTLPCVLVAR